MVVAIEKHFLQDRLIDGSEFLFTLKDLSIISKIIMEESGIVLSESKASLVYSRLAKRIRHLGLSSFSEYCSLIQGDFGKDEKQELIAALTTNVTRFFREQHHFEHMQKNILPNLIREAKARRRIRIWSAACSSGPEPYSIALTILQAMPNAGDYDIRILATDIDHNILKIASSGIYDASQLAPISEEMQRRWFRPLNDGPGKMQVKPELRNLITFKQLNLIGTWPMKGKFQAIFCRNVVIYFDSKTQESIWSRFLPLMEDGGALYIGHSERVSGPSEKYFFNDGTTIYRNRMERR
ncbi:MAG: protein-glutamate O-methyltransferase CheR [Rhodospirillales bacterium]|nr:protein-glutamate O-methyltransferase CheR [Rhodospirillales bacterium]